MAVAGVVGALALVGIVLGAIALTRPASSGSSAEASTPTSAVTVTATSTETVQATVTSDPTAASDPATTSTVAGVKSRPADWLPYVYEGPPAFDVCQVQDYPASGPFTSPTVPAVGSDDYWTVLSAQSALRALNYGTPPISADGQFGAKSAQAVTSFQSRHGVPVTGELDSDTWAALNAAVHYWIGTCP